MAKFLQIWSHCVSAKNRSKNLAAQKRSFKWAYVVSQLVERLILTPEAHGSNPVIGKLLYRIFNCLPTVNCIEKTKIKKRGRNSPFLKNRFSNTPSRDGFLFTRFSPTVFARWVFYFYK